MEPATAELLERYRDGDPRAADELFARYVERLTEMVRWQMSPVLQRRFDAEDAVHSAYRSFFVRARDGQFHLERSGDLWKLLVTITLNKLRRLIVHHRAKKRTVLRDRPIDKLLGTIDLANGPSPLEALATAGELEAIMRKLTPLQRQVLELRLQDRRWDEIAAAVGRSERTCRRALEEIRDLWPAGTEVTADIERERSMPPLPSPPVSVGCRSGDPRAPLDYRDFMLQELVGSGGMGKVYRALQKSLDRQVAVKMLRKARWASADAVERFLEEAHTIAGLHHPGIVGLHGVGRTLGGGPFLVMDFIDGANLAEVVKTASPTVKQSAFWIADAAEAIEHAHRQGIVHCDLKPSNLLLNSNGRIVVSDFGLARTLGAPAGSRSWAGTNGYMAPEQLDPCFGDIGPATDVFALGLVLHGLLSPGSKLLGRRIVEAILAEKKGNVAHDLLRSIPEPPPAELLRLLEKCLAINPEERFANAIELADELRLIATV